ncbi:Leucine dehydrogenase [bacterium HR07]|uniref:Leucine dehydrogenase n=2 Tax=Candidatus Bipolaricaulota TaxID=67810 RepID=H5SC75_9BACT|nr:leucine dehydrogenase [uncultured Acetothermia bacterium]BAL59459.1 leucine dehydrogenase [Candidatus Acetothermum autotrophicum]GBC75836.1 Leucine dehydrogenase [bacterium HR07]
MKTPAKSVHELIAHYAPQEVHYYSDAATGLKTIIVIHSTALGPATGGTRFYPYPSWEAALEDALRLAQAMSYKCALAELPFGGGKGVILGDPKRDKTPELLRAYARVVHRFDGRFTTGEDVGISAEDLRVMMHETKFLAGAKGATQDLSAVTAQGVVHGLKACFQTVFGNSSLTGRTLAVQGAGKVGYYLIKLLAAEGAKLFVSDIDRRALDTVQGEFGVKIVEPPEAIYALECDAFVPCALGGVINDTTLPLLNCKIVAGSANNQLKEPRHGDRLHEFGILYAPDYVINAGGLIAGVQDLLGGSLEKALRETEKIYGRLLKIFEISRREGLAPHRVADRIAEERLRSAYRR